MLCLVDEAKAVDRPAYEELLGNLASATDDAKLVLLSTAGPSQGYFFERFQDHADTWKLHRTPSTESPFARGFAERMREECLGEDDPIYRMRVLAEFGSDVEGQLIAYAALQSAVGRVVDGEEEGGGIVLGVDVARFGEDRTVVAIAQGCRVVDLESWRGLDCMQTADRVASVINTRQPVNVLVDEIGVGSGVIDRLRQLGHRIEAVNVSRSASQEGTFMNLRAEIGWKVRERFERGEVSLPDDVGLQAELASMRYSYDQRGRIRLEEKSAAKARIGSVRRQTEWDKSGAGLMDTFPY
jgi:hypothetical protein